MSPRAARSCARAASESGNVLSTTMRTAPSSSRRAACANCMPFERTCVVENRDTQRLGFLVAGEAQRVHREQGAAPLHCTQAVRSDMGAPADFRPTAAFPKHLQSERRKMRRAASTGSPMGDARALRTDRGRQSTIPGFRKSQLCSKASRNASPRSEPRFRGVRERHEKRHRRPLWIAELEATIAPGH